MKHLLLLLVVICGCKAIEESRDRKAVGRVLSKPNLTAEVGKRVAPCANDTTIISDTLVTVVTDTKYDTTITTDTLIDVVTKVVTKTVYQDKIRTIKEVVLDRSFEKQLGDSINYWKQIAYKASTEQVAAMNDAQKWKGKSRMWMWCLIGLLALLAVGLFLYIRKPKIKTK